MHQFELDRKIELLLSKVKQYNPNAHFDRIEKAARFAAAIHEDKLRFSGDDAFIHCYEIAFILADLKLDSHTIAAGMLHDALDSGVKPETISKEFDSETLSLIQAVTKLKQIKNKLSYEEEKERRAENIRKIILATAKDIRVILIKLADRLHNMRTLKFLPEDRRKIISEEIMDIYAPIAHKLGMYNMKAELEDCAFRFLQPEIYQEIKRKVIGKRDEREKEVLRIISLVKEELRKNDITADIYGRAKHFYSIYKKIVEKNKQFDEIYDLIAIRIITENVNDCYKTLGIVHTMWKAIPSRLKDFIAVPKPNGYQSLHTGVIVAKGKVLEVQIRDRAMHRAAEEGIAAHWRYKGEEKDKQFDRQIEWLKQLLEWKRTADAQEFIESLKIDLFQKEIFVFTPKGDPINLPENATAVDFAYAVHTDIGNHCKQAKVNGSIVPLDHTLQPGDIVEIITVKDVVASRSWLSFAKSMHTRIKIKHALGITVEPVKRKDLIKHSEESSDNSFPDKVVYSGKKYALKLPQCCQPKYGDSVRAFKTKDGKIVIHAKNCVNLHAYDSSKEIKLEFAQKELPTLNIRVDVADRIGVLSEILNLVSHEKYNVKSLNTRFGKDGRVIITLQLVLDNKLDVSLLLKDIKSIESVMNAYVDRD